MLLTWMLLGCAMTPDRYVEVMIERGCEWGLACADDTFSVYDSVAECVEAQEPWAIPYYGCFEAHCDTFDPAAARECLSAGDPEDCDTLAPDACAEVWTGCDEAALAECQYLAGAG